MNMIKAICYKEWLKIRWIAIGSLVTVLGFLVYLHLDLRHTFTMYDPIDVWIYFIQRKALYYSMLKYLPVVIAIIMALVQFFPEMTKKRFRLTFHLPFSETGSLFLMISVGLGFFVVISLIYIVGLTITGMIFFPREVIFSSLVTVAPWLLGGFVSYLGASVIVIDPSWKYRIIYLLLFGPFIQSLYLESSYCQYAGSFAAYMLVSLLFIPMIIFPGYRLRKGSRL